MSVFEGLTILYCETQAHFLTRILIIFQTGVRIGVKKHSTNT